EDAHVTSLHDRGPVREASVEVAVERALIRPDEDVRDPPAGDRGLHFLGGSSVNVVDRGAARGLLDVAPPLALVVRPCEDRWHSAEGRHAVPPRVALPDRLHDYMLARIEVYARPLRGRGKVGFGAREIARGIERDLLALAR